MENESITITYPSIYTPTKEKSFFLLSTSEDWLAETIKIIEESVILRDIIFYIAEDFNNIDSTSWNIAVAHSVDFLVVDFADFTPEKVAFMTNFAKIKKSFISIQGNQKCLEALCFFQSQAIFIESTEELGEQLIDI